MSIETTDSPIFSNSRMATNMPFFDGTTLVFCQSESVMEKTVVNKGSIWRDIRRNPTLAERYKQLPRTQQMKYRAWKLAYCNWQDKIIHPISTGLPADITERSPTFYRKDNRIHLSFIAGTSDVDGPHYRLYTCSGSDLGHLDPPKPLSNHPLIFGFVGPHHICRGIHNIIQLTEKASGKTFKLKASFHVVSSVNYLVAAPAKLVITGKDKKGQFQTVLYDLADGNITSVASDVPVYKASLWNDTLIYTKQFNNGYENRQLCLGRSKISASTIEISKEAL